MVGSAFSTVLDSGRRPQHSPAKNEVQPISRPGFRTPGAAPLDLKQDIYIYNCASRMDGVAAMGVAICPCQL